MDGGRCNEVKHLWVPDLVVLLVRSGGDLRAARQTPLGLAKWLNRRDSHAEATAHAVLHP